MPQQNQLNILKTEVKYLEIELQLKMKLLDEKKKEIIQLERQGHSDETIFNGLNGQVVPKKGTH